MLTAAITLDVAPSFDIGPVELAWHGVMIAVGMLVGVLLCTRLAGRRGLEPERAMDGMVAVALAGIVGARLFFLAQGAPSDLLQPASWIDTRGFAFYGAMIAAPLATWVVLRGTRRVSEYLDLYALVFPLGMAVGRIGDLIAGEHYGPATGAPWGIAYPNPDSETPLRDVAYHSGALYEILAAALLFAIVWQSRTRFSFPGVLTCTVVAGYAASRFVIFFVIRDSPVVALGLRQAQWTSLVLIAASLFGVGVLLRAAARDRPDASGRAPHSAHLSDMT
ncbi:prolipoprotein diacylglyceryl transferase [Paraconexibacter algicola]|uniref:Phosphatidylglycerol--prolipoprotein diacylglyceryl transferase n=1 Tax=Paraconexibacter algicola TaxID=2133960 RepID=A0A2T4UM43_9ACTN|nr:prolipoprotein diacylglyceryl transferase [Paraconexibacter algicola]PTL60284.1 hypothetical protein C7Y72_11860 [Paraconexibacter algicola]